MWNSTNFEQQREHMENAGLSVGLMYGGSGAGSTSTAGGQATQPSGPTSNPVGMALQYKQIEQQDAAIKSQTMLNQAEAAKALAEAGKTAGPEYNKATWEAKNLETRSSQQETETRQDYPKRSSTPKDLSTTPPVENSTPNGQTKSYPEKQSPTKH